MDAEGIKLNSFQKIIATIGILAALAIVPYSITTQKITPEAENTEKQNQENENEEEDDD
jgi:hypothetical protein